MTKLKSSWTRRAARDSGAADVCAFLHSDSTDEPGSCAREDSERERKGPFSDGQRRGCRGRDGTGRHSADTVTFTGNHYGRGGAGSLTSASEFGGEWGEFRTLQMTTLEVVFHSELLWTQRFCGRLHTGG